MEDEMMTKTLEEAEIFLVDIPSLLANSCSSCSTGCCCWT